MSTVVKDLGAVSAYAYAVEKGYTGTEAEFAELMADYAEVGQRAEDAADSALESKTAAQTAATTATNKASEATTAATTATTKAGEASTSASTATSAKDTAVSASQTATSKATEATTAATTATSAATTATTAKDDAVSAKTAAQTAQTGAETAAASVEASAEQIATNASDISQLKSDIGEIIEKTVPLISKADMSDISTYYDNGYYDASGDFVEATGYANYQIGSKSSPYQVYFASTSGGYVQMSVFSGTPSSATFVARYRTSESSLPTSASPLTIPAGYIVVIAIVTYTSTDFSVYLGFNADISFTSDRIDEIENIASSINKKRYVKYIPSAGENASTERLEIYIPMPVGYLCYYFVRSYVTEDKTDIWRISNIYKANDNCVVSDQLSSNAEWECAIRLNGRSDFAGGYMHGDEVYVSLTLFLDGAVVDRTSLTALTPFETLDAVQYSNLFDPNDHTTVFAQHGSTHRWTNKLEILQDIAWVANESLDPSYLAMFPPLKTYTTKWYTDCDYHPRAISLPQQNSNYKNVRLYDTTSGFTADFGIEEYPKINSDGYFLMTDNSGNPYNKCYYAVNGYDSSVQAGDIWKSKSIYIISLTA